MAELVSIEWAGGEVKGRLTGRGADGVLLAHGAGTNQDHPFMMAIRDGLAGTGHTVLTFNYPYADRGSRAPDRAPKLVECHRGAADFLRPRVDRLYLAGRSMGGRIATLLVAEGDQAAGILLYAYPLHPPGKPESLRVGHLPQVTIPMLFFQGTRDTLARMDLFEKHIAKLPNADVEILEGASHSFRGGGWTLESLADRIVEVSTAWIGAVSSGRSRRARP